MRRKFLSILLTLAMSAAFLVPFGVSAAETDENIIPSALAGVSANIDARFSSLPIGNVVDGDDGSRFVSALSCDDTQKDLVVTVNLTKSYDLTSVSVLERFWGGYGSMTSGVTVLVGTSGNMTEVVTNQPLNSISSGVDVVTTTFTFDSTAGDTIVFNFAYGTDNKPTINGTKESHYQLVELKACGTASASTGGEESYMTKRIYNPYLPSYEYIPDGEPYVFGDRVYIFGSHDIYNVSSCSTNYVGWSAPLSDLSAWRYEGVIYRAEQDSASGTSLYAPDVTKGADGNYYLYYPYNGAGLIGVARCSEPAGEYEFVGHVQYSDGTIFGKKSDDPLALDPAVFIDDDGKIYLYVGYTTYVQSDYESLVNSGRKVQGAYCVELSEDMLTVKNDTLTLVAPGRYIIDSSNYSDFSGNAFFEGASMRKINGTYYLIYSNQNGDQLCYATGSSPNGPFAYGGVIVSNVDRGYQGITTPRAISGNNHGSICKIGDDYYIFYHRQTGKSGRQACTEKIEIKSDGSIDQVGMTSFGLGGGEPMLASGKFPAYIACNISSTAAYAQTGRDGDASAKQYVEGLENNEYVGYKYFYFNGVNKISVTARSSVGGSLKVYTGSTSGTPKATITLSEADSWTSYTAENVSFGEGKNSLWFVYEGTGSVDLLDFTLGDEGSTYNVNVTCSEAAVSGAGSYAAGDIVVVSAGTKDDYDFAGWTVSGNANLADSTGATTTFIMPSSTVSLTATWKEAEGTKNILEDNIFAEHSVVSASKTNLSTLYVTNMLDGDLTTRFAENGASTADLTLIFSLDGLYKLTDFHLLERVSNGGRSSANLTADVSVYTKNGWETVVSGKALSSNGSNSVGAEIAFDTEFTDPVTAAAVRVVIHKNNFSTQLEFIEAYGCGTAMSSNYAPGYATVKDAQSFGHYNTSLPITNVIDGDLSTRTTISDSVNPAEKVLEYEIDLLAPRKLSGLSLIEYGGQYRAKATPTVKIYYETRGASPEYKEAATATLSESSSFFWSNYNHYGSYIFFDESITTSKIKIRFEDIAQSNDATKNCVLSLREIVTWCTDIDNVFYGKDISTDTAISAQFEALAEKNMTDGAYGNWSVNSNRYSSKKTDKAVTITVDLKDMHELEGVTVVQRYVSATLGSVSAKAITYAGGTAVTTAEITSSNKNVNKADSISVWFDGAVPAQKVEITIGLPSGAEEHSFEIWEVIGHGKKASLDSVSFEAAGGTVTTLPQTGSFTVKPTYTAVSGNAVSIAALYDSEGRLLTTASAAPGNALEITVPEGKTAANLKVFTWDSMQTAAPILAAYDYAKQVQ